jgi:hypothetical protein
MYKFQHVHRDVKIFFSSGGIKKSEMLTAFTRDLKAAMDRGDFKKRPEKAM